MIALNEILSDKEYFEQKYKLMGKKINLDKIIKLEEKFIVLDKKANELRSNCNKLCGELSKNIETTTNKAEFVSEINKLDKETEKISSKSQKSMRKINKLLKKLPNPALEDNILNISIKTKASNLTKQDFIKMISDFAKPEKINSNDKNYFESLKKVVFKAENLPKLASLNESNEFVLLGDSKTIKDFLEKIQFYLSQSAKYLVVKSIKQLNKQSAKTLLATLSDGTFLNIDLLGEYVSREKSIKFYDKSLDMTQFVNMLKISIK